MYPLLETIKVENGRFCNLPYHQERFDRSRREVLGIDDNMQLQQLLSIPDHCMKGVFKCRFVYGETVGKTAFIPYTPKKVASLKIVTDDHIDYRYKFSDRRRLKALLSRKAQCDDVLIVKQGMITDTSFSNIAFFDGKIWVTPATPLLNGTKRRQLLAEGKLVTANIRISDISRYQKFILINAMLDFDQNGGMPTGNIK